MNNCPFCQSSELRIYLSDESYKIMKCSVCTNAFTFPPPPFIDYSERDFHANESQQNYERLREISDLSEEWRLSILMQVATIKKHLSPGAKILEIGCGEGILGKELYNEGFHYLGIDPSSSATKRAELKGLEVRNGYFSGGMLRGEKFDLAILSQIFEHIEDFKGFLADITASLNTGGMVFFIQTNHEGLMTKIQKKRWYAWVPEQHFWHFTPRGLAEFLEKGGLKKVYCEYSSLVHNHSRAFKILKRIGFFNIFPSLQDQFHLLVRKNA